MNHLFMFNRLLFLNILFFSGICFAASAQLNQASDSTIDSRDYGRPQMQYYATDSIYEMAYPKPRPFQFIKQAPEDLWQVANAPFKEQSLTGLFITGTTTFSLIIMDQPLVDAVQGLASRNHISARESNHILWSVKTRIVSARYHKKVKRPQPWYQ